MSETADSPSTHLTDFPDRLSPMLVKELRQGMRTNMFTVAFILLQAFMVLCILLGAMAGSDGGNAVSGFFWFFVVAALLVAMPIRGFSALTSEISLNTMDLIQLTELGAWRITFGKWAALVSQTLLLVCAILPYLVMRYFSGGVDLVYELWVLFGIVVGSMVLTAVTVGFSAFRSVLLRAAVVAGLCILSLNISMFSMVRATTGMGGPTVLGLSTTYTSEFWWGLLGVVVTAFYTIFFLLDLGASRIAPDAENHATRKRLGAVGFVIFAMLLPFVGVHAEFCAVLSGVVVAVVSIDAITERPSLVPSVLRPFVVDRPWARPLAPLLTPGWHTGIRFFVVLFGIWLGFLFIHQASDFRDIDFIQMLASIAGAITFPLVIIHLFMRKTADTPAAFSIYILVQCCSVLIGLFLMAISSAIGDVGYMILPIPMITLFAAMERESNEFLVVCALVSLGLSIVIPLWRAGELGKATRHIVRQLKETAKS